MKYKKPPYESELDDDGYLYARFYQKIYNARTRDIPFLLSYEDWQELVRRAGLKSSDLGFSGKGYVLARHGDSGPYALDNCRFILQLDNVREMKTSVEGKDRSRRAGMKATREYWDNIEPEDRVKIINTRMEKAFKKRKDDAVRSHIEKRAKMNSSYTGERNSQYGTFWVTDGVTNRKVSGEIPEGFRRGRITKK